MTQTYTLEDQELRGNREIFRGNWGGESETRKPSEACCLFLVLQGWVGSEHVQGGNWIFLAEENEYTILQISGSKWNVIENKSKIRFWKSGCDYWIFSALWICLMVSLVSPDDGHTVFSVTVITMSRIVQLSHQSFKCVKRTVDWISSSLCYNEMNLFGIGFWSLWRLDSLILASWQWAPAAAKGCEEEGTIEAKGTWVWARKLEAGRELGLSCLW